MFLVLHLIGSIRVSHYINKYPPQLQGGFSEKEPTKGKEDARRFSGKCTKKEKYENYTGFNSMNVLYYFVGNTRFFRAFLRKLTGKTCEK